MTDDPSRADGEFFAAAGPGYRYVERDGGVLYLTGGSFDDAALPGDLAPDAVVAGDAADETLARARDYGADGPVYGPPGAEAAGVTSLPGGARVDVGDVALVAGVPEDGRLGLGYRVGGVTGVATPAATLDAGAERRFADDVTGLLGDGSTRLNDQFPLRNAVNVLDVPAVEGGESALLGDAMRADVALLGDRGFDRSVGRQLTDTDIPADEGRESRLAALLEPDAHGAAYVRHDDPGSVGEVRPRGRNGFEVTTTGRLPEQDGEPTVSDVRRALEGREPASLVGTLEPDDGPVDEMEPDGRYAAGEGTDVDGP
jgi:hypothetical protein